MQALWQSTTCLDVNLQKPERKECDHGDKNHSQPFPLRARVAPQLGIEDCYAGLLPEDKVDIVHQLRREEGSVAMVGDGVNDAPVLPHRVWASKWAHPETTCPSKPPMSPS